MLPSRLAITPSSFWPWAAATSSEAEASNLGENRIGSAAPARAKSRRSSLRFRVELAGDSRRDTPSLASLSAAPGQDRRRLRSLGEITFYLVFRQRRLRVSAAFCL